MTRHDDDDDDAVAVLPGAHATASTTLALRVLIGGVYRWVPKSVIHDDSEVFDDRTNARGKLVVKLWWAERERLA